MRNKLNRFGRAVFVLVAVMMVGKVLAFDPPRLIGELSGEPPENFAQQFCWVGDQNEDNCDDILLVHDAGWGDEQLNQVKLFFGGRQMDSLPDLVFNAFEEGEAFGYNIIFLGRLTADNRNWFCIQGNTRTSNYLYFYKGGHDLDSVPDLIVHQGVFRFEAIPPILKQKPSDFNNDGYHDFLVRYGGDSRDPGELRILFGGHEFDTLADWRTTLSLEMYMTMSSNAVTGHDMNNDGFDDFFFIYTQWNEGVPHDFIDLYYGGDPMDTVAAYSWYLNEFNESIAPRQVRFDKFAVLPDINGDGYDDWAIQWTLGQQGWDESGFYVFFGGENPDFEPDLDLDDNSDNDTEGKILGGDLNADGFGDIVTSHPGSFDGDGEMQIYFGERNFPEQATINVRMVPTFGKRLYAMGAIGDYDGDGVLEFCAKSSNTLNIVSHGADWSNVANELVPIPVAPFLLKLHPNPFNSILSVTIQNSTPGDYRISLLDLNGKVISEVSFSSTIAQPVSQSINAEGLSAGLYLVRCHNLTSGQQSFAKAVLLK